ncbi:hypothetical protein AHGSH82_042580 [Aeromonas hydrophila]|uniref:hypothetical protein n=2 Tax=Aeromonas hydrophila TaxID=644 RepID=UPI00101B1C66|nr:hypothetical protein [Aeromonas hydrophila]BBG87113.1 hypothetical protein AHGSH82_042580 [Aeromonas hydrophila]BBT64397.1 hypothetical protein WP8S18E02_41940 [Aeromonas hydrophila]
MDFQLLITFIASAISGIAGVYIQRYLTRAKPNINVTSLSFEGDVVEVSEEIQRLSRKCDWSQNMSRYVTYEELKKFEVIIAQAGAGLQIEKENVDKWLEQFNSIHVPEKFSIGQLHNSPTFRDFKVIAGFFRGSIKSRNFPELPTPLESLKEQEKLLPIENSAKKLALHCGQFEISFKKDDFAEDTHPLIEHLIYSFSVGDTKNIIKIHEFFSDHAGTQFYDYQKLISETRKYLISNAKLAIGVSISNTGQTPLTIRPYFAAKLIFGEKKKTMVLGNINVQQWSERIPFVDFVRSEQYRKSSRSTNYVSVEPGKTVHVNLVSSDGLDNDSNEIAEFYELGGLRGQVFANDQSGRVIKSKVTLFSKNISEAEKIKLLKTAS